MVEQKLTPEGKTLVPAGDGTEMEIIFNEDLVPDYTLKDPLIANDGHRVETPEDWRKRRKELQAIFEENIYGKIPDLPYEVSIEILEDWAPAFDGIGKRKQVKLIISTEYGSQSANMLIYAPKNTEQPVPAFLGLNFMGNQTIENDPNIIATKVWLMKRSDTGESTVEEKVMDRGMIDAGWPVKRVIQEGFALATACYGDFDPDYHDNYQNGLHGIFTKPGQERTSDDWGSVCLWGFGLSRMLDVLEEEPEIDASKVAVVGTSRLAQTSLWAGIRDERFFMIIDNESGCGGSALNKRRFGESVYAINLRFPHWYCTNFEKYNDNESELPMDTHGILAMAAPRPLYIGTAVEDSWSDPKGMYLAAKAASPVYEFLGKPGLPMKEFPEVSQTDFSGFIGFHHRTGGHGVNEFDWIQFIEFFKQHLKTT